MKGENQSPQFDFGENFFKITKATEKPLTPPLPETAEQEKARVMREIMAEIPNLLIVDKHKVIRGPRKPGGNLVEISINQAVTFKKVPLPENPQKFKYQTCEPTWGIGLKYHNKIEISQGDVINPGRNRREIREDEKPEVAERLYQNWLRLRKIKAERLIREAFRPKES